MKKLFYLLPLCLLFCWSCDEIPPDVTRPGGGNQGGNMTINVDDQPRQVLIEEFTGVRCINCPAGSAAIEGLLDSYGNQLVAISIHAGFFSKPYNQSLYDFQTVDGDNILDYLGQPLGFPTAVVNRKLFTGEDDLQINQSAWAGAIAAELQEEPKVKIGVEHTWDGTSRTIDMTVTLFGQESISAASDPRISVMITESGVVDHQLTPQSSPDTDPEYVHKHILRDIITNFDGQPIADVLTAGGQVTESFNFNLDTDWDAKNCEMIVLVHQNAGVKDVLQAVQIHITE